MLVAGADVWKGRWVVVVLDKGRFERALLCPTIDAAVKDAAGARVIGVDMPIGLPEAGRRRPADMQARKYVGPRWQSVFLTPPADLLAAPSHRAANDLARTRGWDGISAQAYGLKTMILQVQPVAARDPRLHEVHPEVSFTRANGGAPLRWPKTSWSGVAVRRSILAEHGIALPDDLGGAGEAAVADILDAAIVAWSAGRIASGRGEPIPADVDRIGAIWR